MQRPLPNDYVSGIWFWGETGTGKSVTAAKEYPGAYYKMWNKWWDGYQGEDSVVIEDVSPTNAVHLGDRLKIWADHGPFIAEVKGGAQFIRPKWIVVTSQYKPESVWTDEQTILAIRRRFRVQHFACLV